MKWDELAGTISASFSATVCRTLKWNKTDKHGKWMMSGYHLRPLAFSNFMVFKSYRTTYRNVPTDRFKLQPSFCFPQVYWQTWWVSGAAVGSRTLQADSMIGRVSLNCAFLAKWQLQKWQNWYAIEPAKTSTKLQQLHTKLVEKIGQKAVESWPAYLCFHWQAVGALVNHAGLGISCFQWSISTNINECDMAYGLILAFNHYLKSKGFVSCWHLHKRRPFFSSQLQWWSALIQIEYHGVLHRTTFSLKTCIHCLQLSITVT